MSDVWGLRRLGHNQKAKIVLGTLYYAVVNMLRQRWNLLKINIVEFKAQWYQMLIFTLRGRRAESDRG